MNCPKCGKELNENQKFCTKCGAKIGESCMQEIINIKWIVISIAAIALVFGVCILAIKNNLSANTSNNNVNNEIVEDTDINIDEEATEYTEEQQEPVAPKPHCVYETTDGVCFTTQLFKVTPMHYYDCTGGLTTYGEEKTAGEEARNYGINQCQAQYDAWAGAVKSCKDWGYKLPSTEELDSLAKDIYSVIVSDKPYERTYLPPNQDVNITPLRALKPDYDYDHSKGVELWEDLEINSRQAYSRRFAIEKNKYWYTWTTRHVYMRNSSAMAIMDYAVCVYDPYGIAKKTYTIPKTVKTSPQVKTSIENNNIKEVEDALF